MPWTQSLRKGIVLAVSLCGLHVIASLLVPYILRGAVPTATGHCVCLLLSKCRVDSMVIHADRSPSVGPASEGPLTLFGLKMLCRPRAAVFENLLVIAGMMILALCFALV